MKTTFLSPRDDRNFVAHLSRPYCLVLPVLLVFQNIHAQEKSAFQQTAPGRYRIEFTDKLHSPFSTEAPEDFLSPRAIERRQKQEIPIRYNDLPVNPGYIDSLVAAGARVLNVSKWFNDASIQVRDTGILNKIARLTFVKKMTNTPSCGKISVTAYDQQETALLNYGPSWWQTAVHNGQMLHNRGYTGKNIVIAVIDAGFFRADLYQAFERLRVNNRILGARDFTGHHSPVYEASSHGMSVLSVMAGDVSGALEGTAPDASFWLLRSEDVASEYIAEEDNWIAAAEFADSAGADIINTSLGYTDYDDTLQSHFYADMDGNTNRISRAADIAASKGMLVVVSAGNEGSSLWKYISAPADADSVIAVGAIDKVLQVASFSSRGPTADGRIKPDVMAIGQGTTIIEPDGSVGKESGTSLSAPVISGLAACLWQSSPGAKAMDLYTAIRKSADRYTLPDNDYGYGIPDFNLAQVLLGISQENETWSNRIEVFPNPFINLLYIVFNPPVDQAVEVTLFDITGRQVLRIHYPSFDGRNSVRIEGSPSRLAKGAYILKVETEGSTWNSKLIRQ